MSKKDLGLVSIIGVVVGILAQPILLNTIENIKNLIDAPSAIIRLTVLLFFVILAPVALYVAHLLGKRMPVIYQFAKFAAVGSLNSFVDLGIFNLETYLYGADPATLSNTMFFLFKSVSFLAATTNSYLWNKFWTFGDTSQTHADTVVKFYAITVVTYLMNTGVATAVKAIGPMPGVPATVWVNLLAPIAGILSAMFANFFAYKYIVFKKPASVDKNKV